MTARRWMLALALVALIVPACSGGSDGGGSSDEDCTDLSTQGDTFAITIENFEYDPSCFTASASQGIEITNADDAVHSFTLKGTEIDLEVPAGETVEGAPASDVLDPGTYDLFCTYHPDMTGEVTVVE